jgi:hypothetical protein
MSYRGYINNLEDIDLNKLEKSFEGGLLFGLENDVPKELHESIMKLVKQDIEISINHNLSNYLNNIINLEEIDDKFEGGLLADLKEETPSEFHNNIVNLIKDDKKKISYFNYKKYMPVAVAATILVSALSFSNNIIQNRSISQNITESGINQSNQLEIKKEPEVDESVGESKQPNASNKEMAINNNESIAKTDKVKQQQSANKPKSVAKDSSKTIAVNDNSKSTEKTSNESTNSPIIQSNAQENVTLEDNKTVSEVGTSVNKGSSVSDNSKEEPVIMYSLAFGGQVLGEKTSSKALTNSNEINYELQLSIDQIDIIDFVNSRGSIISYRIYSLSREDENILNVLLSNNHIEKKIVNEVTNNNNVIVKLSISSK